MLAEHRLDDNVAGLPGVERMLRDQVAAFGNDLVGILHELELLVTIVPVQPHAFADDFKKVDNAKRPVTLMCAQLAMIGMIDCNQRVNARVARRFKLIELKLAFERGKYAQIDALQSDRWLPQIDEFDLQESPAGFPRRLP